MNAGLPKVTVVLAMVVAFAAPWALVGQADAEEPAPSVRSGPVVRTHVVVLDFVAPAQDAQVGADLAERVRLGLTRRNDCEVIDAITTRQFAGALDAGADAAGIELLMSKLAADVAVWGAVSRNGRGLAAEVRCLYLTDPSHRNEWTRRFTAVGDRAAPSVARQIVEAVCGRTEWTPPPQNQGVEPNNLGRPVNVNGGFEQLGAGWEPPDNAATFIVEEPARRGRVLRIRTDLARDPYLAYRRAIMLGQADPSSAPEMPSDATYGSLAGLEGVQFCSDWIRATPGRRYWLTADAKCPGGGPRIFVKGYRDMASSADGLPERSLAERGLTSQDFAAMEEARRREMIAQDAREHPDRYRREVYRWYLSCGRSPGQWAHYAGPFPPLGGLPATVQWLQIQVYAYWPPGEYLFDNVFLYADPHQRGPLPEEPARTPNASRAPQPHER